jgi:hypothetical protein
MDAAKRTLLSAMVQNKHKPQTSAKPTSLRPDFSMPTCGIMKLYDLKGWLKQNELYVEGCTQDSLAGFHKEDGRVYIDDSRIEVVKSGKATNYDSKYPLPKLTRVGKITPTRGTRTGLAAAA